MTKTLYLLRHAKASRAESGHGDSERPLSKRGHAATAAMARYLKIRAILPDLILCSAALRTRETFADIGAAWPSGVTVEFSDDLYLADVNVLRRELRRLDDRLARVMVIGHNPGLADLALHVVGAGDPSARRQMAAKYPTGALAEIELDIARWSEIKPAAGRLLGFVTPEMLAGG